MPARVNNGSSVWTPDGGTQKTVANDTIWDAAGDLAVATAADTAAKLSMGTALQVLRVNSGATGLEWAAATPSDGAVTFAKLDYEAILAGQVFG